MHEGWLHGKKSRQISGERKENPFDRAVRGLKGRVREDGKEAKLTQRFS